MLTLTLILSLCTALTSASPLLVTRTNQCTNDPDNQFNAYTTLWFWTTAHDFNSDCETVIIDSPGSWGHSPQPRLIRYGSLLDCGLAIFIMAVPAPARSSISTGMALRCRRNGGVGLARLIVVRLGR
ncbi:hypothetical protein P280DRAFT_511316 [Massarina eburnea CBS 473.64]|uniref:Uncharacterized protein n=1 Tax=Massarina eburnea CBS 473.64 TaxID=1395130 RepID=A0A6A6RIS7_9PLEO|nr:hypothetical protein P280DRAFT_511316 [Massarina eburnea CBS 473.64]